MRQALLLSLLVPAAAACTDSEAVQVTQDTPIAVAASADRVVVAATSETETTGFGCGGGGGGNYGPSVLFVSTDRGGSFERIVPDDSRPLTHLGSRDGVFYALAHSNDGGFGVMTSADGRTWTQVASGTRYAQDLAISDDAIVVAHSMGVLVSTDGSTWTDHELSSQYGYYQAKVAHAGGTIALGSAADGTLKLSTDAASWTSYAVPGFSMINQLIAAGDSLLVTGYTSAGTALARLDLANLEAAPVIRTGFAATAVLTPIGLLDIGGQLASLDATTIGAPVAHLTPFHAAAVDAQEVVVLRAGTIETSTDGGRTFGGSIELPIERTETPIAD